VVEAEHVVRVVAALDLGEPFEAFIASADAFQRAAR